MTAEDDDWKLQHELLQREPLVWALDADALLRSYELVAGQAESDLRSRMPRRISWWRRLLNKIRRPTTVGATTVLVQPRIAYVPDIGPNALMLGALATEVMLKGIALQLPAICSALQSGDASTARTLWSHDIRAIARLGGVPLNQTEEDLCELLETFLLWAGRYSTPKKYSDMMLRLRSDGSQAPPNAYLSGDFDRIRNLTKRLRSLLPQLSAIATNQAGR